MLRVMKYKCMWEGNALRLSPPDDSGVWEVLRVDTFVIEKDIWVAAIWKVKEKV